MNNRTTARFDRFNRILAFRDARAAQFPAGSKAAEEFALVETAIADMETADQQQAGGKQTIKGGTTSKSVLLDALRLDMSNIARTAQSIADKEGNPGFVENYRLPKSPGRRRCSPPRGCSRPPPRRSPPSLWRMNCPLIFSRTSARTSRRLRTPTSNRTPAWMCRPAGRGD